MTLRFSPQTRRVFHLSLPIFAELLLQLLVGNMDQFMISPFGTAAVSAIGNGNQVMNVVIIVLTTMSTAATILLTQHIGAGRVGEECSEIVTVAVTVSAVFSFLVGLFLLLEPELVRLAARKASDESIARMKEIHREMEDRLKRYAEGEYIPMKEFRKLDIAFHKAVIEGCENQIISRSLPMFLATCTEWYSVWTSLDFGKVLESFRRYHRKILEAVESHDADSAYRYAAEHTQEIIDIYESSGKKSRKSE